MRVPFSARRRAEVFDALASGAPSPTRSPLTERDAERFADLLAVVDDLRSLPEVAPRPEFTASLRTRLLAEADTLLLGQPARPLPDTEARLVLPHRTRSRDRKLATLLGGAALIGATSSMVVAAQTALPGESLYPVKRAIEDARTGLASDDADRGARLLANARGRLAEVDALSRSGSPGREAAEADTLVSFDEQATAAAEALLDAYDASGDEDVIGSLRTFAGTSLEQLAALEETIAESARDELVAAGNSLADIDTRAASACGACGGTTTSLPPLLLTASAPGRDVATVLSAGSTSIVDRGRTGQPVLPATVSGQDVGGIVVPELDTAVTEDPTGGTTTGEAASVPTRAPEIGTEIPVKDGVDDVTKLLTGDVPELVDEVPVVGPAVGPTVDGVVGEVDGSLDETTDSLLD